MVQNSMEEVSVEELIIKHNLIVPEIQREYVWGFNSEKIVDKFITDIINGFKAGSNDKDDKSTAEQEVLKKLYDAADDAGKASLSNLVKNIGLNLNAINIGFLYSYRPDYYVFNDVNEDVYLIDGQQRFTTLFLLLFYLSIKENRKNEFEHLFRFDKVKEHVAFDYRVRTLTHNFFIDLVSSTDTVSDLNSLSEKNWFLSNYKNDVTIQSIIGKNTSKEKTEGVFSIFNRFFENDDNKYYDYVRKQIKFWHFKAEETSQGEELYITMNSRGQQLADNENLRAFLFQPEEISKTNRSQLYWAEEWEKWQDFFWKHRNKKDKDSSADVGFNEFLRWIQIIKMTEQQEILTDDENENAPDKKLITETIKAESNRRLNFSLLSLTEIQNFFNALNFLFVEYRLNLADIRSRYSDYSNFNLISTKWLSPEQGKIDQIDCFRLLPVLAHCKDLLQDGTKIDIHMLFRTVRYFYNLSKVATIAKTASVQCINALKLVSKLHKAQDITDVLNLRNISSTILSKEERFKLELISSAADRVAMEEELWLAEDIEINKGEIKHLIDFIILISTPSHEFHLPTFKNFVTSYKELLDNEDLVWGDLIPTNVYHESGDRINYLANYHEKSAFLQLTEEWRQRNNEEIQKLLNTRRKKFLSQYKTADDLKAETSIKNQIYIYYIFHNNIHPSPSKWHWYDYNFGAYSSYANYEPLFDKGYIYQFFNHAFRENETKILWCHSKVSEKDSIINQILSWSNS